MKVGEELTASIEKKGNVLKELFGAGKSIKKSAEQMVKEAKKELESKWMK